MSAHDINLLMVAIGRERLDLFRYSLMVEISCTYFYDSMTDYYLLVTDYYVRTTDLLLRLLKNWHEFSSIFGALFLGELELYPLKSILTSPF